MDDIPLNISQGVSRTASIYSNPLSNSKYSNMSPIILNDMRSIFDLSKTISSETGKRISSFNNKQ